MSTRQPDNTGNSPGVKLLYPANTDENGSGKAPVSPLSTRWEVVIPAPHREAAEQLAELFTRQLAGTSFKAEVREVAE